MPLTGFVIAAVGLVVGFASFAFLVVNMGLGVRSGFSALRSADSDEKSPFARMAGVAAKLGGGHALGMLGMALGGFVLAGGLLLAVVQAIQTYAPVVTG